MHELYSWSNTTLQVRVRSTMVLTCCSSNCCFQAGLWYGGEVAQHLFGQGPEVSQLVQHFCRYLLPGLWPMVSAIGTMHTLAGKQ